MQRATRYPAKMPVPDGMPRRTNAHTSWVFRRNYTWSAVDGAAGSNRAWQATTNHSVEAGRSGEARGWDSVLCAMDTFGQERVYRWKEGYNGYCLRGQGVDLDGFQRVHRVARCRVTFAKSKSPSNVWDVKGKSLPSREVAQRSRRRATRLGHVTLIRCLFPDIEYAADAGDDDLLVAGTSSDETESDKKDASGFNSEEMNRAVTTGGKKGAEEKSTGPPFDWGHAAEEEKENIAAEALHRPGGAAGARRLLRIGGGTMGAKR